MSGYPLPTLGIVRAGIRIAAALGATFYVHGRTITPEQAAAMLPRATDAPGDVADAADDGDNTSAANDSGVIASEECVPLHSRISWTMTESQRWLNALIAPSAVPAPALAFDPFAEPEEAPVELEPPPAPAEPIEIPAVPVGDAWHFGGRIAVRQVDRSWLVYHADSGSIVAYERSRDAAFECARNCALASAPRYGHFNSGEQHHSAAQRPNVIRARSRP